MVESAILGDHVQEEAPRHLIILGQARLRGDDRATRPEWLAKIPPLLEETPELL
jgi:hypothetical protein